MIESRHGPEYRPCAVAGARDKVLAFALSFPETAEDRPWEDDVVVKVRGKIFVFAGPTGSRQDLGKAGGVARPRARDRRRRADRVRPG